MGDPRDTPQPHGPSWYDVARLAEELQTRYDCQLMVTTLPKVEKGRGITSWWVQVHAKPVKRLAEPDIANGQAYFRGARGAATYTAAMWWALYELQSSLEEQGKRS